jgi:Tfp pilus assembly protein PilO
MSGSSIRSLRPPQRLRELFSGRTSRRLRWPAAAVLAFGAVNACVYLFLVVPAADRLAEQEARYSQLKRQYAEALLFQKQRQMLSGLEAGIPSQKDVPLLIKDLVQTANRLKLSVGAINSDIPTQGKGRLTQLTFSVPVTGAYPGIKRFIYDVETTEKLVGIQDLKLDSEKGSVRLNMKLVTYIRGE